MSMPAAWSARIASSRFSCAARTPSSVAADVCDILDTITNEPKEYLEFLGTYWLLRGKQQPLSAFFEISAWGGSKWSPRERKVERANTRATPAASEQWHVYAVPLCLSVV